jgi:hypothetical protein
VAWGDLGTILLALPDEMHLSLKFFVLIFASLCMVAPAACEATQEGPLGEPGIRRALVGKVIAYAPPGWADAGIREEFRKDRSWKGIYFSRGPVPFSGRWIVAGNRLCVTPDPGTVVARWFEGRRCRRVWRAHVPGQLLIEPLQPYFDKYGPLPASVEDLNTPER